jgi:hypothetical protein
VDGVEVSCKFERGGFEGAGQGGKFAGAEGEAPAFDGVGFGADGDELARAGEGADAAGALSDIGEQGGVQLAELTRGHHAGELMMDRGIECAIWRGWTPCRGTLQAGGSSGGGVSESTVGGAVVRHTDTS